MNRLHVFKNWFINRYLAEGAVVALHIDKIQPRYRDQYPGNNNPETPGLRAPHLAAILGSPELAVPSESYRFIDFASSLVIIYLTEISSI